MDNCMLRILIETTVRQTLKGFQEDPGRSVRNLVDLALQFSDSPFQNHFFQEVSTILEHQDSPYYALAQDAAAHISTEHLVKFGLNLGCNGCALGAKQIRTQEQQLKFHIPWTVLFVMEQPQCTAHLDRYDAAIRDGEQLGIFTWMLLARTNPLELLPLVQQHSNSAFFLFCRPEDMTPHLLEELQQLPHLMPVVRYGDAADEACAMLRKVQLPYSVYCLYSQENLASITSGELFCDTQQLHPLFTVLVPGPGCPDSVRRMAHQAAIKARTAQAYQTIPWELQGDTRDLDRIISHDARCVLFDGQGRIVVPGRNYGAVGGSLFTESLPLLLQQSCPLSAAVG